MQMLYHGALGIYQHLKMLEGKQTFKTGLANLNWKKNKTLRHGMKPKKKSGTEGIQYVSEALMMGIES